MLGRRPVNVQCKVNINSLKEVCERDAISAEIVLLTLSAGCHFWNPFTSGGGITITWNDIQYGILMAINLLYITRSFEEDNCKATPTG